MFPLVKKPKIKKKKKKSKKAKKFSLNPPPPPPKGGDVPNGRLLEEAGLVCDEAMLRKTETIKTKQGNALLK